jgi:phosphonate transport system ATP-binding protein
VSAGEKMIYSFYPGETYVVPFDDIESDVQSDDEADRSAASTGLEAFERTRADHESAVVRVRSVTKQFGGAKPVTALRNVDLSVERGELLVLIGLSGSGKSTLLRHLNGLHTPTSGDVSVLGTRVSHAPRRELRAVRRRVGFIFQQFNLVPRSTVLENIMSGALGRLRGPRFGVVSYPHELRVEAAQHAERVGLGDRLFQRAGTLSGGQQQRVGIARMLMQRPELVLADEPVASLDPEAAATVMDLLFRICHEDRLTVICSLHQVDLALQHGSRIVGLLDGEVVLDRPAAEVGRDEAMAVYRRLSGVPESDGPALPSRPVEQQARLLVHR